MTTYYARSLPADLDVDEDEGTCEGILVPWDAPAPIVERRGDGLVHYEEVFRRGACDRALRAPGRLALTYGHSDLFPDRLGVATHLEDRVAGLWGRFRFDRSKAEQARDAVMTSHQGLSITFASVVPKPLTERDGSLVERRSVVLFSVAAVPDPAYATAGLTVVRSLDDVDLEETAADVAARAELDAQAELLRSVHEAIAAGQRWAGIAGYRPATDQA
jgi:HK97 family phage prohead protease